MLKEISIKHSLIGVLCILICSLITLGVINIVSLGKAAQSLQTVYEDRLVATGQLDQVMRAEERIQFMLAAIIIDNGGDAASHFEQIKTLRKLSDDNWQKYMSTYLTTSEMQLAKEFASLRENYNQTILSHLYLAIQKHEYEDARRVLLADGSQLFAQMRVQLDKLIQLQLDVAQQEYYQAQQQYKQQVIVIAIVLVLALLLSFIAGKWLVKTIGDSLNYAIDLAEHVAQGDLSKDIQIDAKNETGQLLLSLDKMNQGLTDIVHQVRQSAEMINQASDELAQGYLDLSHRTESQASNLEETASAIEQMTAAVQQNAGNAEHANQLASTAREQTHRAGQVVSKVLSSMSQIKQQSNRVAEIIGVIDGIAFQTNILALNAAVEAARAGEQGRGFAVVATEVRSLAQRSAHAAQDIKNLISASGASIAQGDSDAVAAGATMVEVFDSVNQVAELLSDISSASKEQSAGITQINQVVTEMEQSTQQNAALVEQASAATLSLQAQAGNLTSLVSQFQLKKHDSKLQRVHLEVQRFDACSNFVESITGRRLLA